MFFTIFFIFGLCVPTVAAGISGEIPSLISEYKIVHANTKLAISLDTEDPDEDNRPYVGKAYTGLASQHFMFEPAGGSRSDLFYIKNVATNQYLQINYASFDDGATVHEWRYSTQANAAFKFLHESSDNMQIIAAHSGQCLGVDSTDRSVAQINCESGPDTYWLIDSVTQSCHVMDGADYKLVNRQNNDSQVLEVTDASRKREEPFDVLSLNTFSGREHQKFNFRKSAFAFTVTAKHSGMAMQVADGNYQDNVAVVQVPLHEEAPVQQWRLEPVMLNDQETGYCFVVADHSGKALDTQFRLFAKSGRTVVQNMKNTNAISQHWKLERA